MDLKCSVLLALFAFSFMAMALPAWAGTYGPTIEGSYCQVAGGNKITNVYRNPDRTTFTKTLDCGDGLVCRKVNSNRATCGPAKTIIGTQKGEEWYFHRRYCDNGKLFIEYRSNLGHYDSIGSPCKSNETCVPYGSEDAKCVLKTQEKEHLKAPASKVPSRSTTVYRPVLSNTTPINTSGGRTWDFTRKYCLPSDPKAYYVENTSNKKETRSGKNETYPVRFACKSWEICGRTPSGEAGCIPKPQEEKRRGKLG
ncbi:MAG: hypothetical protein NT067_06685 [Candidatus Diapherotrites archaeon]|nr:hypothetical protein [Candidatus Diapherotrites archaeon]